MLIHIATSDNSFNLLIEAWRKTSASFIHHSLSKLIIRKIRSNENQEPNRGIRDNTNVLSTSIPLSPSTNVYRSNILSSTPNVGQPFTITNASSHETQIRRPKGRPRLYARALTDITNIRGSSQVCPPNVLPTSQNVSPTTNVAPVTNHTNCSSQATQVPRLRGRPCLSTRALTDITNKHGSAQPPQFCSPNVSSTTNVPPLTTETNGSSQATQVRRRRGRPPLSARPLSDITNIIGSSQPSQSNVSRAVRNVRPRLPSQHDRMSSLINPTPPVMLSSVTVVDNQGNQRRMTQYADFGDATYTCAHCQAKYWKGCTAIAFSSSITVTELMDYNGGERFKFPSGAMDNNLCSLVQDLITILDMHNPLVQSFRMAKDRFVQSSIQPVTLHLIGTRLRTGRQYNLPTASKVVALIPGDGNPTESRNVIVEERSNEENRNGVKRIFELHQSFMALQYPLLFPYGEDGFHLHIPLNVPPTTKRKYLSLREYYCFHLQIRVNEGRTLHKAGRWFHTFCVDAYTAVLDHDLDWYKRNQHTIRSELYNGLHDRITNGETNAEFLGRKNVLPSTLTGGPRHMIQQYQDAMAICHWAGPPDLFITMTCNPKWPEIQHEVENCILGQPTVDRPDTIARVFKMKLDDLMEDIHKGNHFGRVKAGAYCISSTDEINHVISAELPFEIDDPIAFIAVRSHMMHGPCGELYNQPHPHYRRPNNGRKVQVGRQNIMLDNRFVVPHNIDLIVKYDCHINVEWCSQGTLVKYLFSYLNKGPDRATVVIEGQRNETNNSTTTTNISNTTYSSRMTTNSNTTPTTTTTNTTTTTTNNNNTRMSYASILQHQDEIEQYLSCRYISASESCWHLLGYKMHYRSVAVERLPFHEEGCNRVYFRGDDDVDNVIQRETAAMSKFTEWMKANEMYPEIGSNLTYAQFPTKFTWHKKEKVWKPRKSGMSLGRIYYVSPSMGEKFYLRMLLNVVRKTAINFLKLPQIDYTLMNIGMNRLIAAERMYNANEEWSRFTSLYGGLNPQQRDVNDNIMQAIRSLGRIVLFVASSGIASLLLPGGRTAHSRFHIPMELDNESCCGIDVISDLADLIRAADLIIWDEAPLQHRHAFEAVDRTFRDICRLDNPNADNQVFGGKVVMLGGDF
ncbi:putative DNA helicase [Tanacetum coccineum]